MNTIGLCKTCGDTCPQTDGLSCVLVLLLAEGLEVSCSFQMFCCCTPPQREHTVTCPPLLGQLPLSLALLLLLLLQLLPELLALPDVALGRPVVRLQQLRLVEAPQLLQLLFVLRNQLLDFWLQA